MGTKLHGITVVNGKGGGKAYFVGRAVQNKSAVRIDRQEVGDQIIRFNEIRALAKADYQTYSQGFENESAFDSSILNIYEHILEDPAFVGQVVDTISKKLYDLESAIREVSNDFIKRFDSAGTAYFKERSSDMVEVCEKLIGFIHADDGRFKTFEDDIVLIVLRTFTPSDILEYDLKKIKAIVAASSGKTSHAAILASSYSIPVVSGIKKLSSKIHPGDVVYVDADNAVVHVRPSESLLTKFHAKEARFSGIDAKLRAKWNRPAYTKDGIHIEVMANISLANEIDLSVENGADGVGLVRTEYLLSNRKNFPSEDVHMVFYEKILDRIGNKECTFRMMDIGGDKIPEFFNMPTEFNPFMGWRAVRILLERKDIFETQLSAILKAGELRKANYKIMFPMVTVVKEWLQIKEFVEEVANKLGVKIPKLGVLFEVPLAILEMETFMKDIDFASIGTNDLLQYLSAADRNNPKVNYLYNPIEPAFLKILKNAIDISHKNGIPISICGEMAGSVANTALLIGLGLKRFSVIPKNIPAIKEIISNINYSEVSEYVQHLHSIETSEGIKRWVQKVNRDMLGDILKNISQNV